MNLSQILTINITRMKVNSFQDREYVIPCQALIKQAKNWPFIGTTLAKHWAS